MDFDQEVKNDASQDELADLRARLAAAEAERDAYRKAKQENDERFMLERDEARSDRDALRDAAGPFVRFFAFKEAIQELDEAEPLPDGFCVASAMGGGGSDYLWASDFRKLRAAYAPPAEEAAKPVEGWTGRKCPHCLGAGTYFNGEIGCGYCGGSGCDPDDIAQYIFCPACGTPRNKEKTCPNPECQRLPESMVEKLAAAGKPAEEPQAAVDDESRCAICGSPRCAVCGKCLQTRECGCVQPPAAPRQEVIDSGFWCREHRKLFEFAAGDIFCQENRHKLVRVKIIPAEPQRPESGGTQ